MNPLKTLFNKVFDSTPPLDPAASARAEAAFEWNPDEETVAPTSARTVSWKREDTGDDGPKRVPGEASDADIAASAHNLPAPLFEKSEPSVSSSPDTRTQSFWNEPAAPETAPFISMKAVAPSVPLPLPRAETLPSPALRTSSENWVKPSVADLQAPTPAPLPVVASPLQPLIPTSDFEDVYRKAGIKSPVHGYGVERVYRLLTSRRLVGLDRTVKRSALLTALDAAGVPPSDVSQDAVLRRKALTAYEAEKALELQSLRSRNESRAEALQENVETFTRQKQSQIERLAQGSTSAVRAQSDLEIRKRMEQDRLYRSLAYFVEPLPSPSAYPAFPSEQNRPAPIISASSPEARAVIETFEATVEIRPMAQEEPSLPTGRVPVVAPEVEASAFPEAVIVTPPEDTSPEDKSDETLPIAQSGLEMALRAAAQEARTAGWGQPAMVEDSAFDAVDALRKLREGKKADSES